MSLNDELQSILQRWPEVKRIKIEREEVIERFVASPIPPKVVAQPPKMDLFVQETVKEFPKVKKTLEESSAEAIRAKQIKETMAGLQLPKV